MDDLRLLGTLLAAHEPSPDVIDRSRHLLLNRMSGGGVRRVKAGWLGAGLGLTAAAAATVAVIAATQTAPVVSASPPAPKAGLVATAPSGPQVLLAAATVAEKSPDGSGIYWYLKVSETNGNNGVYEYWIKADGEWWFRGLKTGGKIMKWPTFRSEPFSLIGVNLTLDQLRGLPTDPVKLKAWIAEAERHTTARTSAGLFTAGDEKLATFWSLISLVSTLPAPSAVRAAAFRAIASYPDVRSLGAVPGGQGLLLPSDERLVVDPATGRVNQTSTYFTPDGGLYTVGKPDTARIQAKWTNTLSG